MERQFVFRELTIPGEILHVLGLQLFLSHVGIVKRSRAQIVCDGKAYVDDLYMQKQLEPLPEFDLTEVRLGGYGGLGMFENGTAEYQELFAYLEDRRKQVAKDKYPEQVEALLKEMESDPQLYFRRLCFTNSGDNRYARIPILAAIDPERFVSELLKQHPAHQRVIILAFKGRYEHGALRGDLAPERPWLTNVHAKLLERAGTMSPIGRHRLLESVKSNIEPMLVSEEETSPGNAASH